MKTNLYIDLEWFMNQEVFLIGYAYSVTRAGQLYEDSLNIDNVISLFEPVNGSVFFYGPDIGMLEKNTGLDIKGNFDCVNLLPVFRNLLPGLNSYRLADIEDLFGIYRSQHRYKSNIFKLSQDWFNPYKRNLVLKYNLEDVVNLVRLKKLVVG